MESRGWRWRSHFLFILHTPSASWSLAKGLEQKPHTHRRTFSTLWQVTTVPENKTLPEEKEDPAKSKFRHVCMWVENINTYLETWSNPFTLMIPVVQASKPFAVAIREWFVLLSGFPFTVFCCRPVNQKLLEEAKATPFNGHETPPLKHAGKVPWPKERVLSFYPQAQSRGVWGFGGV